MVSNSDLVETEEAARSAVAAAQRSAREGRARRVSLDDLDAYFDELKAEAAAVPPQGRRAGL